MSEPTSEETSESRSWRERVASMSPVVLIGSLVLALAVAGIAGFGLGFKVEQHRAHSSNAKKTTAAKNKKKVKPSALGIALTAAPWTGTVTQVKGNTVAIKVGSKSHSLTVGYYTAVNKATTGARSDLTKGARVQFKPVGGATKAILVVPSTSKAGIVLTEVTPTTMTYIGLNKKPTTIKTEGAAIFKLAPAKVTDLTKNTSIMVNVTSQGKKKSALASRIVVLPAGVTF